MHLNSRKRSKDINTKLIAVDTFGRELEFWCDQEDFFSYVKF